ncbi:MAG: hypothetical protein RR123_04060 [Clostridia bacterium]
MYNKLQELFLIKFFEMDAIVGKVAINKRELFMSLASVYCIFNDNLLNKLYNEVTSEDIFEINTLNEYNRTMRVLDYNKRFDKKVFIDDTTLQILNCKGLALKQINRIQESCMAVSSVSHIWSILAEGIEKKEICMFNVAAFMQCEGFCVNRNIQNGLNLAWKCAKWNNIDGLLIMLKYDKNNTQKYLEMLNTIVQNEMIFDAFNTVFDFYAEGKCIDKDENTNLMSGYFRQCESSKEIYNEAVARMIFSKVLLIQDKKNIIFSENQELIVQLNELPLNSVFAEHPPAPIKELSSILKLERKDEVEELEICLNEQKNEIKAKPLLLICEDKFVLEEYESAFTKCYDKDIPIKKVSAKSLTNLDIAPSKNNFVIETLTKTKSLSAIFIIEDIEKLTENFVNDLTLLLQRESKFQYKLEELKITINLQNCVFILLANKENVDNKIKLLCHEISVGKLAETEKNLMVNSYIELSKEQYKCNKINFEDTAIIALCKLNSTQCENIINKMFRKASFSKISDMIVTNDDIKLDNVEKKQSFGFEIKGDR